MVRHGVVTPATVLDREPASIVLVLASWRGGRSIAELGREHRHQRVAVR
jgi:hypothetical protein